MQGQGTRVGAPTRSMRLIVTVHMHRTCALHALALHAHLTSPLRLLIEVRCLPCA
jgi:hypothetical protein